MSFKFETVAVPAGAFIGWHEQPGQVVTGKVLSYDPVGGQDFNGATCPLLELELIEPCASFNKAGEQANFSAGEVVSITCGLANLKAGIRATNPARGDILRITRTENARSSKGNMVKVFGLEIARGAAPELLQSAAPAPTFAPSAPAAPAAAPFNPNPAPAPSAAAPF